MSRRLLSTLVCCLSFALTPGCIIVDGPVGPTCADAETPYNGLDDDCDETTRDDDLDGDGALKATDCDDTNAAVNPSATEVPYNGKDDDCNSATRDDDLDQDGALKATDCDDTDAAVNPSATEVPYNGKDDDCSAATRDDDLDADGFIAAMDCNDADAAINPNATDLAWDGVDTNCDGRDLGATMANPVRELTIDPALDGRPVVRLAANDSHRSWWASPMQASRRRWRKAPALLA